MSPLHQRQVARALRRGRKVLLAKAAISLRDTADTREFDRLQSELEKVIHDLPMFLRGERFLDKHLFEPAVRTWERLGAYEVARLVRGWNL